MLNFHITPKEALAIQEANDRAYRGFYFDDSLFDSALRAVFANDIVDRLKVVQYIDLKIHFDRESIPDDQRFSDDISTEG